MLSPMVALFGPIPTPVVGYSGWIVVSRVPSHSWDYTNYEVVAIFDKLVAVLAGLTRWILLKNQFLYTDEYCDAIEYEGLVFAATTRGTIFA